MIKIDRLGEGFLIVDAQTMVRGMAQGHEGPKPCLALFGPFGAPQEPSIPPTQPPKSASAASWVPPRPVDPQSTALTVAYLELNADRPWLGSLPLLARRSAPSLCSDRGVEGPPAAAAEAVLSLLTGGKSPGLASMINQSRRSEPSAPVGCGGGWDKWIGWSQVSQRVGEPQAGRLDRLSDGRGPKPHPVDTTARPSAQRWIPRWLRGPACRWRPFHSRQWHADGPLALESASTPPLWPPAALMRRSMRAFVTESAPTEGGCVGKVCVQMPCGTLGPSLRLILGRPRANDAEAGESRPSLWCWVGVRFE